jgi:hypothetical protein
MSNVVHQCGDCGRIVSGPVCMGPHPGFRLHSKRSEHVVELPEWWAFRQAEEITVEEEDVRVFVTARGTVLRVLYDRRRPTEAMRDAARAVKAAEAGLRRAQDEAALRQLAEKLGYEVVRRGARREGALV